MNRLICLSLILLSASALFAQQAVKRYVLIEHFTNSRCGICASKNPDFFALIGQPQNASEVHHLAIHPQYPYPNCEFHQANPSDNTARASLYGIQGTPRVALNGTLIPASSTLLSQATLNSYMGQTSPLHLKVSEAGSGSNRSVNVIARSVGNVPPGTYRMHIIIAEKLIAKTTPNGEKEHHNVLRDIISSSDFTPAASGGTVELSASYTPNAGWNAAELYAIAFVQNIMTKEVLNSGTRFDPAISAAEEAAPTSLSIQPNPAHALAHAQINESEEVRQVEMFSASGQRSVLSFQQQQGSVEIPLHTLAPGMYVVKITTQQRVYTGKLVKQ
ncbi:MAG TPA: T9SS type A sorting domain-containing protein [Saprospiraceae bacterium]|nr:T9SS type A sorting domain-containing protein [Saprospiraceae bacterium]HND88272.1 T9SS type A sorting domain-containing protein [Saprospiraceae bacterium]HNG89844.1 T9SS type A sorting domain-containing protein [Saprospiraceae bacterium]